MKSFAFSPRMVAPRVVLTAIAITLLVGSLGVIGWKWRCFVLSSALQTQDAHAKPAALPTATPNDATSFTTESAAPISQRVEAPREIAQAEVSERNVGVARSVSGGSASLALAQVVAGAPFTALAQGETLGILKVRATPSLVKSTEKLASTNELMRTLESLPEQLIATISGTEKFQIIARSDLDLILKEQGLSDSGNLDLNDRNIAKQFAVRGIKYGLVVTVDDFQDHTEEMAFGNLNQKFLKRTFRLSTVSKIYNTTTAALLQAPRRIISLEDPKKYLNKQGIIENSRISDELIVKLSSEMAEWIAHRVIEVLYPARVVARTDMQITINWGDGTGIQRDLEWEVFKLGKEMDLGNGEKIQEETLIAKAKVIRVNPKFSQAQLSEEKEKVQVGAVLRRSQESERKDPAVSAPGAPSQDKK